MKKYFEQQEDPAAASEISDHLRQASGSTVFLSLSYLWSAEGAVCFFLYLKHCDFLSVEIYCERGACTPCVLMLARKDVTICRKKIPAVDETIFAMYFIRHSAVARHFPPFPTVTSQTNSTSATH